LGVLAIGDDAAIADMDVDTIVGLDAIDGFKFRAVSGTVAKLVVSSAIDDGALDIWTFEGAARNGDDGASAVLRLAAGVSLAQRDLQLHDEL